MPAVPIKEIVALVGGRYGGPDDRVIRGVATLTDASEDQLSFLGNLFYVPQLSTTHAGAILVPEDLDGNDARFIRVSKPHAALAEIVDRFFNLRRARPGISPQASIAKSAKLGANVAVGAFCSIGEDVEIGEGTKIDNLVQVGHNVRIGKHCLFVAQVGIAGSTELGDYVVAAGQAGFSGHLKIGNRAQVGGGAAVFHDIPDGTKVIGSPAIEFREYARRDMMLKRLLAKKR